MKLRMGICVGLMVQGCGLERDWQGWQQASQGEASGAAGESSSGSSTRAAEDLPGEASSTGPDGAGSSSGEASESSTSSPVSSSSTEATGSTTSGPGSECGDGVVSGEEECDDPWDETCNRCYRDRVVFVTSKGYNGDWMTGFVPGDYDYACNMHAALAGLVVNNQRRFKVWISTSEESAAERLFHSPGRYVLVNGLVFADSWDDIVAGKLVNPLNVDENSETQNAAAWTDTRPDGSAMDGDHCSDWTSTQVGKSAYYGEPIELDSKWTMYPDPGPCAFPLALYCFESP